jgi:alpha-tubulin suppressor-like RCC1 family protein
MYIPWHIFGQFATQPRLAGGWRAPLLLALTAVVLGCDGSSETDLVGPNMAVVTATRLVFTVEPNATTATAAIFPAVQVTARDASGNTVTSFKNKVSMVIGHNPTGGVLFGGSATATNGVATFTNLIIGKAGTGYTLIATYGKLADTSVAFNVALPATQLIFSVQPSTTSQGATISPAVQVTALDKKGNLAEGYRQNVTVAIGANPPPGTGTLDGTKTVTFVHGVATFSDLSIDMVGSGYTLRATSLKLADTSAAFDITVASLRFTSVSAGNQTTCAVTADGKAYCWGDNTYGQVGDGTMIERMVPVPVSGGLTFAAVSAGELKTCGVTLSGAAYCWGRGDGGGLGNGLTSNASVPVAVSGDLTFASVSAAGQGYSCGVTTGEEAYCWGYGAFYTLGTGNNGSSTTPVPVSGGLTFASVSTSNQHSCGLTTSKMGYCWGQNGIGQLGDGTTNTGRAPVAIVGDYSFVSLAAGGSHTCGVTTTGEASSGPAYCWGNGNAGQLGNGTTTENQVATPVPAEVVGGLTFTSVSAGGSHTCGLTTSEAAYCWGLGSDGQLGNNTFTFTQNSPVAVSGEYSFASVSAGTNHVCGVTTAGVTYCWGSNGSGELGNGTNGFSSHRNFPVAVSLQ